MSVSYASCTRFSSQSAIRIDTPCVSLTENLRCKKTYLHNATAKFRFKKKLNGNDLLTFNLICKLPHIVVNTLIQCVTTDKNAETITIEIKIIKTMFNIIFLIYFVCASLIKVNISLKDCTVSSFGYFFFFIFTFKHDYIVVANQYL